MHLHKMKKILLSTLGWLMLAFYLSKNQTIASHPTLQAVVSIVSPLSSYPSIFTSLVWKNNSSNYYFVIN